MAINIGKKGITEGVVKEINMLLEKKGVVKVKLLKNFRNFVNKDRRELAREIASKVDGELVDLRGFVLTFKKFKR